MNSYFTEHLAGENFRESKSGEEYFCLLSVTALVIYLSQVFHHLPLLCMCFFFLSFFHTVVGKKKSFI